MNQNDVKRGLELCEKATEGYSVSWMQRNHANLEAYPDGSFEPVHIASFDPVDGYKDLNFCAQSRTFLPDALKMVGRMANALFRRCKDCGGSEYDNDEPWNHCRSPECQTGQILREYFKADNTEKKN